MQCHNLPYNPRESHYRKINEKMARIKTYNDLFHKIISRFLMIFILKCK